MSGRETARWFARCAIAAGILLILLGLLLGRETAQEWGQLVALSAWCLLLHLALGDSRRDVADLQRRMASGRKLQEALADRTGELIESARRMDPVYAAAETRRKGAA